MIQENSYLGIVVDDLEGAIAFYQDTLGLVVNEVESIPGQYCQFDVGGALLSLQKETEIPTGQPFEPAFIVDDVDATYADWQAKGVELLDEPHDLPYGRTFLFKTPAGQIFRAFRPLDLK